MQSLIGSKVIHEVNITSTIIMANKYSGCKVPKFGEPTFDLCYKPNLSTNNLINGHIMPRSSSLEEILLFTLGPPETNYH